MEKEKSRIIVIEGPEGIGKSTLANYLKDNIAESSLYCLSNNFNLRAHLSTYQKMYGELICYLKAMELENMDMIFDGLFFKDEVYSRLGYKDYNFTDVYNNLVRDFVSLNYHIYYFSLYLEDKDLYKQILGKNPYLSVESLINEQNMYHILYDELTLNEPASHAFDLNTFEIPMDDIKSSYDEIKRVLKINN